MESAVDKYLEIEVSGASVACYREKWRYRYICPQCGEPVYLAAADSTMRSPHFKHYDHNNNSGIDCENYTATYQEGIPPRTTIHHGFSQKVEFYYDYVNKQFEIGLAFNESDIEYYGERNARICLTIKGFNDPLLDIQISRSNFYPDSLVYFPLRIFSNTYYLKNSCYERNHELPLFRDSRNNKPTIFRKPASDSGRSRLVDDEDNPLYTDTDYFLIMPERDRALPPDISPDEIIISRHPDSIRTMETSFYIRRLKIKNISERTERLVSSWGYKLLPSEEITVLWPPLVDKNDVSHTSHNSIYLTSSFRLIPTGNTNLMHHQMRNISGTITEIAVHEDAKVKIYYRNTELNLVKKEMESILASIERVIIETDRFTVPKNSSSTFLHFCAFGVEELSSGVEVFLTPESYIKEYKGNYHIKTIRLPNQDPVTDEQVLTDILTHYKRVEPLGTSEVQPSANTQSMQSYLDGCKKTGKINSFIKMKLSGGGEV